MRFLIDSIEALPQGQCQAVTVNGTSLLIIHTAAGFFAALNQCPHLGLRLDNATLVGNMLACLRWAANEPPPEALGETRRPLITSPVIVEAGQVYVEVENTVSPEQPKTDPR